MIGNIFKQQPKYIGDLHIAISSINNVNVDEIDVESMFYLGDYGENNEF